MTALILLFAQQASAFGLTGHRAIGQVAERYLSPAAQQLVVELLGEQTLAEVSTWADEIRSDPAWKHASTWHYVTIEDDQTYDSSGKNPDGDLIEAIHRFVTILRDPRAEKTEKAIALKWLVHLVGDLHQPLHVSRGADKGGNTIRLRWFNEQTNLHAVWDDKLIESMKLSYTELADFLRPTKEELSQWQTDEIDAWVRESFELRENVYAVPKQTTAGAYEYAYKNNALVKQRLTQAGVRLAALLNKIAQSKDNTAAAGE